MEGITQTQQVTGIYTRLAKAVSEAARHYAMVGRTKRVVSLLRAALELGEQEGSLRGRALLMADLGGIIWKQGRFDEALELLVEARQLAEAAKDRSCLAIALYHLGELAYGKSATARVLCLGWTTSGGRRIVWMVTLKLP